MDKLLFSKFNYIINTLIVITRQWKWAVIPKPCSRLTWDNILSILQKYPKDPLSLTKFMEESIGTGR